MDFTRDQLLYHFTIATDHCYKASNKYDKSNKSNKYRLMNKYGANMMHNSVLSTLRAISYQPYQ